jgi:NAD(P)-dependent dehydrogenase (short-subunit alcohol dehydrogenase family)
VSAFRDKVAIVTGGASGIGKAVGQELARRGAVVVLADVRSAEAEDVARSIVSAGGRARAVTLDVTDAGAVAALVDGVADEHGRLDYMFNNAGIAIGGETRDLSQADWDRTLAVNLHGVVHGLVPAYRRMLAQGHGHIVNTASTAGLVPAPGLAPYAASKFAVVGLSTTVRAEAARYGVKVSAVCPGIIETPLLDHSEIRGMDREQVRTRMRLTPYAVDAAALDILAGVERNLPIIVFPTHARVLWYLNRYSPALLRWFMARELRRFVGDAPPAGRAGAS